MPSDTNYSAGVAISPNSRYIYACSDRFLFQFDLQANPVESSLDTIGIYDGFIDTFNGYGRSRFFLAQLAPDGKIYINAPSQTRYMSVIDHPDLPGAACGLRQHGIELPTFNTYSMPNFPNFRLGPVDGSPCDTLGLNGVAAQPHPLPFSPPDVLAYPNPASTSCTIGMGSALPQEGRMEVHDMHGRLIEAHELRRATLGYGLNTTSWSGGSYVVTVWCGGEVWGSVQVLIEN